MVTGESPWQQRRGPADCIGRVMATSGAHLYALRNSQRPTLLPTIHFSHALHAERLLSSFIKPVFYITGIYRITPPQD